MRHPDEITHNGRTLAAILAGHRQWLEGGGSERADLGYADLRGANLRGADLRGANLWGAIGNMREVKTAHFDRWEIAWTTDPTGQVTIQIGCQRHDLTRWEKSDPRWIAALDHDATEWWGKYRDVVLTLVKASPATPYGQPKEG